MTTVAGKRELARLRESPPTTPPGAQRGGARDGGRKSLEEKNPDLLTALDALIDPVGKNGNPVGRPCVVRVLDFLDKELGKAIPYGSTTSCATRAGSMSASTTTPRRLRSRASGVGGCGWAIYRGSEYRHGNAR
jgi:hypothetical protein